MFAAGKTSTSAAAQLYVDDVFSTYLYTGTGNSSTQTITNGIDLSGKGGLVWTKTRASVEDHQLYDTVRGRRDYIRSNTTDGNFDSGANTLTYLSSGFQVTEYRNVLSTSYVSWTFREAPKFFDVVTWTGDGSYPGPTISHNLGVTPGCIIIKALSNDTSLGNDWWVWHRSLASNQLLNLNTTGTPGVFGGWLDNVTSASFTATQFRTTGVSYVAYLFAHDTATDGIIQCGSFTTDGSGNATVNLGWEPQWVMIKRSSSLGDWTIVDTMRGLPVTTNSQRPLFPNTTAAEAVNSTNAIFPTATGFVNDATYLGASNTYIYIAIRRPNKPPTTGTQVYNAIARTGTGATATVTGVGFAPDWVWIKRRDGNLDNTLINRLTDKYYLSTTSTAAETYTDTRVPGGTFSVMDGFITGTSSTYTNTNGAPYINYFFRRAPGVFDEVCYTGTGANRTVTHNLGVVPELMIVKNRGPSGGYGWAVYASSLGNTKFLRLDLSDAEGTNATFWNNTSPTSSVFATGINASVNQLSDNYVAYLFATCPGISKVFSYTGNGTSQTINCGFSTGARFVLIKRTDSTGDWYVWNSATGIVAGNDPHLSLNSTNAEVTTDDSVDTDSTGFIVNQDAATNVNVTSATYIGLAFA